MREFREDREPCPFLPRTGEVIGARVMKELGGDRGPRFYLRALECAQSLWLQGLPAQSILLLDRAFGADVGPESREVVEWPLPYAAMHWVLDSVGKEDFIGNPRRHFQHLATRMVEPRRDVRSWRAWACWLYARQLFPDLPADEKQIREEGIREPSEETIGAGLDRFGHRGESAAWRAVLS